MQSSLVFRDGCLKVVWNVRLVCIESIGILSLLIVDVHFNIWKKLNAFFIYVSKSIYFLFVVCSCFSEKNRLIRVLLFFPYSRMYRNHVVWQIWASMQKKTVSNRRNTSDPFEIRSLCSFHQVRYLDKFLVHARTGHRQHLGLSLQDFQTLPQKICTENCLTWSTGNVCKNNCPRPTGLFSRYCWKDFPLFATATQLFCFPVLFAAVLKDFIPLITSPIFVAANSNISSPMRFAAGTTHLRRKGIVFLTKPWGRAPNPLPFCLPTVLLYGISTCL